jgi:hypothetical protein
VASRTTGTIPGALVRGERSKWATRPCGRCGIDIRAEGRHGLCRECVRDPLFSPKEESHGPEDDLH